MSRPGAGERFWARVARDGECWLWTGAVNRWGYGIVRFQGKPRLAHRVAYELIRGTIPSPQVNHLCDVKRCVRPSHLYAGTHADNMRDHAERGRGRGQVGETSPRCRLSDSQVAAIRASSESALTLARTYGVSRPHIYNIRNGKERTRPTPAPLDG